MHRISLISIGTIKTPWIIQGCALYSDRIGYSCDFSHRVLPAGKPEQEHAQLRKAVEKTDGVIVALDEKGKTMTSTTFSQWISKQKDTGVPVTFVLGGAYGLNDEIRQRATTIVSLSPMTFPHELCQLIFLEQLYRAQEIIKGSGYHH